MPFRDRFFKVQDERGVEGDRREYHKTSEHWDQPSLADKIMEAVNGGLYSYEELRAWAEAQGYAARSFVQTVSDLRMEGRIDTRCGGIYPDEYTGDDWV